MTDPGMMRPSPSNKLAGGARHAPDFLNSAEWAALIDSLRLSPREEQVLLHLLHGHTESHIAELLHIGADTVHTYVKRIYHKTGANTHLTLAVRLFALHVSLTRDRNASSPGEVTPSQ